MNSLREVGNFVGIPNGAWEIARFDASRTITLNKVSVLIDVKNPANRPRSLGAIIQRLQNLPPLTLQVELLTGRQGEEPFEAKVRLNPSDAIIWHTNIYIEGQVGVFPITALGAEGWTDDSGGKGGEFAFQVGPGIWEIKVERAGIGNTGMAALAESGGQIVVQAKPAPPRPPPPPPPPLVICQAELDADQPGGGIVNMHIFGGGFQPGQPGETVEIIEGGQVLGSTQADQFGSYSVRIGFLTAQPPVHHTVHAHGQASQRISNEAGFNV
jgi:hypothetical protein